ncbi:D-alanyl-D-alanine carboxypeptidase family protein [Peptostreptococcus stomatis]|uniref:D-alanyl-D-alanine carboxypeptidase family protein n=1 Tax=Peptostreptococcus stomatis TaxID=341694 RepID=UPI0028D82C13|nr:serine hydrolase [Peptostreptococcus stomatis]
MKVFKKIVYLLIVLVIIKYINPIDMIRILNYNSKSIYVYNITEGKEVLGINENKKLPPASLAKIMTVNVALGEIRNLSNKTRIDFDSYKELRKSNSSMAGFYVGEIVTYRDLLFGTILESGGECAETLALSIDNDREAFIRKMNVKARDIGLKNSKFQNPTGLDEKNQYSTAKDIGRLLNESLKDENFRAIFTRRKYISSKTNEHPSGIKMDSTVLKKLYENESERFMIIGGKSGTTNEAGRCWATLAVKGEKEYIVIVMGAPIDNKDGEEGQILDTIKILNEI